MATEIHGGRESTSQDGSGQRHLCVDALLFEHGQAAAITVAGHHPVRPVVAQPTLGRLDVDTHAGQAPSRSGSNRVGFVHLAGIEPAEHGDGEGRQVTERRHGFPICRVDVGEEVLEAVG